ncbi:methyltransferase [Streptomyces albidus (ex Kaewkla and Franco 2022)]|uniref:methyltransferase n=1 Tax=Streptomyces albidus (ex Kaewkla and Franco 2022) TaxID=722709 RepID=UPI0015EED039|nr:methyltransferase [Streptomyces albidus (ex Kaewkla and Franco 2022)]
MHADKTAALSPAPVLQLTMAFYGSQALVSAVELDVFTQLADEPLPLEEAERALGIDPRGARDFLDALVALDLLDRDESGYRSSTVARRYLDRREPTYVGGYAMMAKHYLMPMWGKLTDAVRTGAPQVPTGGGFFDGYQDPNAARPFLGAMDAVNAQVSRELTELVDWERYTSFVDVGGARGNLAATLVNRYPDLGGTVFDLPQIEPFFQEHVEALGVADRVGFRAGDFFDDPLPQADVHILGHILHYYGAKERRQILESVYESANPGGGIVVYDRMIDDERSERALSLLGSLNMLLTSDGGREYTLGECHDWLREAGFEVQMSEPVGGMDVLVFATKPSAAS